MRVLSLLSPGESSRLRHVAPPSWVVRSVTLRDALVELAGRAGGALVLDPTEIESGSFDELLLLAGKAGARLVLCGEALDIGAPALVEAGGAAHVEVLGTLIGERAGQAKALIALHSPSIPACVLRIAGQSLLRLPQRAAMNAVRLFTFAPLPKSVGAMCRYVGRHQTTLGDYHRGVGLCPPHHLLRIARVARVCRHAAQGDRDGEQVAVNCGFRTLHAMSDALRGVFGVSYRALLARGVPSYAAQRLAGMVHRASAELNP